MLSHHRSATFLTITALTWLAVLPGRAQAGHGAGPAAKTPATAAVSWSGAKVLLPAEKSTGGVLVKNSDGSVGVVLDKSCERPWPEVTRFEWGVDPPLPPGWWHGRADFCVREGEDCGYWNGELDVVLRSAHKPAASMFGNFHPAKFVRGKSDPQHFDFWIYLSTPAQGVHVQDAYARLFLYKRTWPLRQIALEHVEPKTLSAADPITLELPVAEDGTVRLPRPLPPGLWCMHGAMSKPGEAVFAEAGGHAVRGLFSFNRWNEPAAIRFFLEAPLERITVKTTAMFPAMVLDNSLISPAVSLATPEPLATLVDPARPQSAQLELVGSHLGGEAPSLAIFPRGLRTAVLTSWDDGAMQDLRAAEVLHRQGYHPTFLLNQNSPVMKHLDNLEAQGVEVGSHCWHHPFLYNLPPQRAKEECVEMRKLLEKDLKHPVISFAYPNGYAPAYDAEGEYVLRAVRAAGYWSGRTTDTALYTYDSIADMLTMKSNGFFGGRDSLLKDWKTTRGKEGGIFYFWGHSWQIGQTDAQWNDFEKFVASFAHQPDAWYASLGEMSVWLWSRANVKFTVLRRMPSAVAVELRRPWLHPWLAALCPLTLKVPAGVESVRWQGRSIPVKNGLVELSWPSER